MNNHPASVTENLLKFCYTCDHAHKCDSEAMSVACWLEELFTADEPEEDETRKLLRLYAE